MPSSEDTAVRQASGLVLMELLVTASATLLGLD